MLGILSSLPGVGSINQHPDDPRSHSHGGAALNQEPSGVALPLTIWGKDVDSFLQHTLTISPGAYYNRDDG